MARKVKGRSVGRITNEIRALPLNITIISLVQYGPNYEAFIQLKVMLKHFTCI